MVTDALKPECRVITDPDCLDYLETRKQWAGLKAVVKVSARRETAQGATVHVTTSEPGGPGRKDAGGGANIGALRISALDLRHSMKTNAGCALRSPKSTC